MNITHSLLMAMRKRIVPGIVAQSAYQQQGRVAPDEPLYIRETLTMLAANDSGQTGSMFQYLMQFDVFVRSEYYLNVTGELYRVADMICAEFAVKDPEKIGITLEGWQDVQASVDRMVQYAAINQEESLYQLPVQVYVTVFTGENPRYIEE